MLEGTETFAELYKLMKLPVLATNLDDHNIARMLAVRFNAATRTLCMVLARGAYGSLGALLRALVLAGKEIPVVVVGAFANVVLRTLRNLGTLNLVHACVLLLSLLAAHLLNQSLFCLLMCQCSCALALGKMARLHGHVMPSANVSTL